MSEETKVNEEEVAETAMCVWEWVIESLSDDNCPKIPQWREAVQGTASLRSECLILALVIEEELSHIHLETGICHWNKPFDWEVIPAVMERYVEHISKQSFGDDYTTLRSFVREEWKSDHEPEPAPGPREFEVHWSKIYVASGVKTVTARTAEIAEYLVDEMLGDLEGSMNYVPEEDKVEAHPKKKEDNA